jgi:lipoprotein-anchoring transpeptidase ErfK/SrfK
VVVVPPDTNAPQPEQTSEQAAVVVQPETANPETVIVSDPGIVSAEIVADTPIPEYTAPPAAAAYVPGSGNGSEHWIDVNLSEQRVYAYEGDTIVNSFVVSTGTWQTPTVTGKFNIWIKLRSTTMTGPGYYLPNVPYTMYFYKGYGLHGTYWHNNFGTPMSHGCVNLSIPDSEWLYNFSSVGTLVNVHY